MSDKNQEIWGIILGVILISYLVSSCTKLEDRPDYKKGYEAGYEEGIGDEKTSLCQQIENAKDSIHQYLEEAGICP